MLKTCNRCGRIVPEDHICPNKREYKPKEDNDIRRFRNSARWINKSIEIRENARYLCEVCMTKEYDSFSFLNYKNLEVHHIEPMSEDYSKRLDNDNLVCLCSFHHKMAEKGEIPREFLKELAKKREK